MAKTLSTQKLALGASAPNFSLPSTNGFSQVNLSDYQNKSGYLIAFLSNHCPFVKHIADEFSKVANEYQKKGIAVFAISSNSIETHPDDSPEKMTAEAKMRKYEFPYLYDETQEVAKKYYAACTPDFFLFDKDKKLVYRGQLDDSRPSNDVPVTCSDLTKAMDALLAGQPALKDQKPSLGCNIKWKPGNEPDYYTAG